MSSDLISWTLAILAAVAPQSSRPECPPAAQAVLEQTAADVARGAYASASERVRIGASAEVTCDPVRLAAWAWRGWTAAVAAANRGGSPEALAPVTEAIAIVTALGPPRSEAAYAAAVLRAAAAASQDERDEMLVWIEEAQALSVRLTLAGAPPRWPLPIELATGELWHGVNDYQLAEAAFERALAARESPAAWRGVARARDRRGNGAGACDAYRRVQQLLADDEAPGPLATEARGYLLLCSP